MGLTYYNNLHSINDFHSGNGFSYNDGQLNVASHQNVSATTKEINDVILSTLEWAYSKSKTNEERSYKNKIRDEMSPGGSMEKIALSIAEIRKEIIDKDHLQEFEKIEKKIHEFQIYLLNKYEKQAIDNLDNYIDLWNEGKMPIIEKGEIKAADDDTDESGMQEAQLKIEAALKWIEWKFANASQLGLDLTQDLRNIEYGGEYDKWLFILEEMDKEVGGKWISADMRNQVQSLRKLQHQKIGEKIQWCEKTCPAMVDNMKNMMLSLRVSTSFSPIKKEKQKIKEVKQHLAPAKPKENIASTSFMIKTVKMEPGSQDFEQASKDILKKNIEDIKTQVEFFAKPCLGEPDSYLSEIGLKYDDVIEHVDILPHKIEPLGFQPGESAIRERIAYKLQEAIGIDFGIPHVVILDVNFNEFHLDEVATKLYENDLIDKDINPCYNPFTCFIQFIPNAQSLNDNNENLILDEESHKPLINTIVLNADGHLNNCLFKDNRLILLDFAYGIPIVSESLDEIRQCKNLIIDLSVASKPMSPLVQEKLANMDIEKVIKIIREDIELHREKFGDRCSVPEETYKMLQLNLLLLKIGAELNKTPKEIDAVQCPIRRKTSEGAITLHGGEYVSIYEEFILGKREVDWDQVGNRIKEKLSLPLDKRITSDKIYSSLRLRKIES